MMFSTVDSHALFLAAALGACALVLVLEVWWLRRDAQSAAREVAMADADGQDAVREPVLKRRNPETGHGTSQGASA